MNDYFCATCYTYTSKPHEHTYQEVLKKVREENREVYIRPDNG